MKAAEAPPRDVDEAHRERERLVRDAIDRLTARSERRDAPAPAVRRVLVALDGTDASRHALAWAREMARATGAEIALLTVVQPPQVDPAPYVSPGGWHHASLFQQEREAAELRLERATVDLRAAGIGSRALVATGSPVDEIAKAADRERADLVVVGSHRRGAAGRLLLGSVADGVKGRVAGSVLVARAPPRRARILVPVDGSRASRRAASLAVRLAAAWGAGVTVLHVLDGAPPGKPMDVLVPDAPGVQVKRALEAGDPAERIVALARDADAGLVVMGSRGLGAVRGLLVGSVSAKVTHHAPCAVLLVKEEFP